MILFLLKFLKKFVLYISASNNKETFIGSDKDDIIDKLFDNILQRLQ